MTDEQTPEEELGEELEMDGEDQDSGHDGAPIGAEADDEDLDGDFAEQEEDEEQERDEEGVRSSAALPPVRGNQSRARTTPAPSPRVHSDDELPYIDDRASKIWVAAIVGVFTLILIYGLLFGKSGALSPPTPSPEPTSSPVPTASHTAAPSPSITAVPSITPVPSVTITPAASATAAPSATSCPTPTPAPTPTSLPSPGC
jgi:hypothetical protein